MQNLLGGLIQVQLFTLQILCIDSFWEGRFEEEKEAFKSSMASKLKLKQLENIP
jgi:hypothetical protein